MICPACRHDNPERAKFCLECGARFAPRCPQCGTELPPGAKFCLECGHRLEPAEPARVAASAPAAAAEPDYGARAAAYTPRHLAEKILKARSALEGERRHVTVLFADLAGFTTFAERLDPEEVHRIMERCFEVITAEVHRFEGTVNQYTGDGVMALFGAPIAHEDAPRRAAHAALGIQRAVRQLGEELQASGGPALGMRIGLNTGPVVVGRIGDDLRMDYTAVGDTTNLAARMQQSARPGTVVATETTQKTLAGFFDTRDLGEIAVKGHAPVRAFEVVKPRGRRSRLDVAVERGLTPLVGRGRDLATLLTLFAQVRERRGQVAYVIGEAGIGKSRLLLEFRRALAERGDEVTWLEGQCVSFGQSIPFLPLIDQLRRNFGIEEFDGEPEIIAKVEHAMRRMGELAPHIPYIRFLLSVDPGDPAVAHLDALTRRKKVFEAVRMLSLRGAQLRPLVLVFEDLHWIDSSTEEYIAALMDSLVSMPILLILTHRVGYTPPFGTRSYHTTLNLQTLSAAEVGTMAGQVLGTEALPRELLDALMEKAEGVPLFVEEVTKTLVDLGVLRRENGGYHMVSGAGEMRVPDTIQGIIMARLDRLGEDGKRTVQLASVIGRSFLVRLLERIADVRGRLDGLLQELKALEIVYEQGLLPEPSYIFKHAVIQDVAYQSLLVQRRKELHRAVGYAIEELYPDRLSEHHEELAHHFWQAEDWAKALEYLVLSGDRARHAYANQAALDFYAGALEAAQRLGAAVSPARVLAIHEQRVQVYVGMSRYPDAIAEGERMVERARAAGDRRGEGSALTRLAFAHWATFSAEHIATVQALAQEALAIGRESGDQRVLAQSLHLIGSVQQMQGELAVAEDNFMEAIRLFEAGGLRALAVPSRALQALQVEWQGDFPRALTLLRQVEAEGREAWDGFHELLGIAAAAKVHIARGDHAEGLAVIEDGLAKARDRDNRFFVGRLENTIGWLHQELGDFSGALARDQQGADIGQQIKNGNVEISSFINVGYDYLNLGEPARALTLLAETQRRAETGFGAHRWRWDIHVSTYIAETLIALGRADEALPQIARALAGATATGSAKYIAKALWLRGEIALTRGAGEEAERDLQEALAVARRISYPTLTWQCAHALSRALALPRPAGDTRDRLRDAYDMATLAWETVQFVRARVPSPALATSFLAWPRVHAINVDLDRLRHA